MTMPIDDEKIEVTKQNDNKMEVPAAGTVWPPPPNNQKASASREHDASHDVEPNYPLALLKGAGVNFITFWFFTLPGSALLSRKKPFSDSEDRGFFWIVWGLSLAVDILLFVSPSQRTIRTRSLVWGAILMSIIIWLFRSYFIGL